MFPNHPTSLNIPEQLSDFGGLNAVVSTTLSPHQPQSLPVHQTQKIKKKRSLPGNPDPEAEVIALSPKTLMATNRFVCEICNKGFQREQNLQLHRRGHNLPWKLKQRNGGGGGMMRKRAYVCPEESCVHHHPSRALGDLTGIKKHYCRKHGEKKWKCDKCDKIYAVYSDWKAHSKTCGTRDYRCDCGTLFSRKDSFITHRAFCDALAEESARISGSRAATYPLHRRRFEPSISDPSPLLSFTLKNPNPNIFNLSTHIKPETTPSDPSPLLFQDTIITEPPHVTASPFHSTAAPYLSATALLQKAATVGSTATSQLKNNMGSSSPEFMGSQQHQSTRDFLGLEAGGDHHYGGGGGVGVNVNISVGDMLTSYAAARGLEVQQQQQQQQQQGFAFVAPGRNMEELLN